MKILFPLIIVLMSLLTGCARVIADSEVYVSAGITPVEVVVSLDEHGKISVSGGLSKDTELTIASLGPIELSVGIQKTLDLTKENPFTLFILWKNEKGEIRRSEYKIGEAFYVTFKNGEMIEELQGDNNSIILVIRTPEAVQPNNEPEIIYITSEPQIVEVTSKPVFVMITPTPPKATKVPAPVTCPGALSSKLHIGDTATVNVFQLNGRSRPGFDKHVEHVLAEGREVTVIEGPQCVESAWWWKVHFAGTVSSGEYLEYDVWMPEADFDTYYLK